MAHMDNEYLPLLALTVTVLLANWTMFRGLRTEFQDLRTEFQGLRTEFQGLRTELQGLRTEFQGLRDEFQDLRTELKADIHRLEDKIEEKVDGLRKELKADIQDLQQAQHGLNERMARIEGLVQGLQEAIVARSAA